MGSRSRGSSAAWSRRSGRPLPCRIIAVNDTNGTFRFHQIRPDESWNSPDLDAHREDKMIVVDIEPSRP